MKKSITNSIYVKIGLITFIALALLIPTAMIEDLINERAARQQEATFEVSSKWGEAQTLTGPIITIPYYRYVKQESENGKEEKITQIKDFLHFLPDSLTITATVNPEKRHRGIYDIVVYNAHAKIEGMFNDLNWKSFDIKPEDLLLDKATLEMGITDLRSIEKQVTINWNDSTEMFNPGLSSQNVMSSGINANIALEPNTDQLYTFSFDVTLKGSEMLYFVPVGKTTDVYVNSTWKDPSFNGAFLPESSELSADGFKAHWNILNLNRNFPQKWSGASHNVDEASFGVDLLLPVDNYQKSTRAVKYAILFIALTFMVFFFVEVLNKSFIHPIQYILVGLALVIFFSLLIAISEHVSFNFAYILAAISTLLLIVGYVKAILKSWELTGFIGGILTILYGFIFVIIQLQDYALLIGSIAIFIILGLVMYFSRKIDWSTIYLERSTVSISENEAS